MVLGHRARLAWMSLFAVFAVLAAIGFVGQRLSESAATGSAATLCAIEHPRLVLANGWLEQMQFNSIEPVPTSEAARDGRVVLSYDSLERGHRSYDLELDDGDTPIARVERAMPCSRATAR